MRIFFFILFSVALTNGVSAQKPKEKSSPKVVSKRFDSTAQQNAIRLLKELDSLSEVYGDSAVFYTSFYKERLNDSTLNFSSDTSLWDTGEFVSTTYKSKVPVKAQDWTNDFEHLFSIEQIRILDALISNFEKETTNEVAIVTIPASWSVPEEFDSLVLAIHNMWGVGKKDINNGIVIGVSAGLRKVRISNGYGIEKKLSDMETKEIVDQLMIPEYKEGNMFEGTRKALIAIMGKVR